MFDTNIHATCLFFFNTSMLSWFDSQQRKNYISQNHRFLTPPVFSQSERCAHVMFCRNAVTCLEFFLSATWSVGSNSLKSEAFTLLLPCAVLTLPCVWDVSGGTGLQEPGDPGCPEDRYPWCSPHAQGVLHDPGRNSVQHHAWR